MSEEENRARFEAAYAAQFGRKPQNWDAVLGKYLDAHGQGAWWAWQTALASVVVHMPPAPVVKPGRTSYTQIQSAYHQGQLSVVSRIEAAGGTIKGGAA